MFDEGIAGAQAAGAPADGPGMHLLPSLRALVTVEPHALGASARVFGSLWAAGALASWIIVALQELAIGRTAVLATAVMSSVMAVLVWSLAGRPQERWVAPLSLAGGLPFAAAIIAATGGSVSPGRGSLIFAVVFAAWAFPLPIALVWEVLTVLTFASPLLYSEGAEQARFAAEVLVQVPHWLGVAFGVVVAKRMLIRSQERAERMALEHSSLRRIATAATELPEAEPLHRLVAEETARLTGARSAAVAGRDGSLTTWPEEPLAAGAADQPEDAARRALGADAVIAAPVQAEAGTWGVVAVPDGPSLVPGAQAGLSEVASLLGLAASAREGRRRLAEQAATDALTGLANRRALDSRLAAEVSRAERHGTALVLVLVDLDHLKQINDTHGHAAGDAQLRALADALRRASRTEDFVARLSGDEFVWLLPDTDRERALGAVDRLRSGPCPPVSVGLTAHRAGNEPADLLRHADLALYAAKAAGRGTTRSFDASE